MRAVGWQGTPSWQDGTFDVVHRYTGGIPRRINRLCSRVLLSGTLEQADLLTVPMVEATALELEDDLGAGSETQRGSSGSHPRRHDSRSRMMTTEIEEQLENVAHRLESLERSFARRERVFQRLMDLFAGSRQER
jgi:chromosome segregation ATPase